MVVTKIEASLIECPNAFLSKHYSATILDWTVNSCRYEELIENINWTCNMDNIRGDGFFSNKKVGKVPKKKEKRKHKQQTIRWE